MDAVTFDGIKTTLIYLLIGAAGLSAFGGAIDVILRFRKPKKDADDEVKQELQEHDEKLEKGKRWLEQHDQQLGEIRRMNQVQCLAMKALLSHEINGNSIDKLRKANDMLDRHLIGFKEDD